MGQSQVPIHHYTNLEGFKLEFDTKIPALNAMDKIDPKKVMSELVRLKWF
ncbi:MAG: hypothetical protein H6925_00440 [Holosporaceae bacterium]|nr:MAG: hypothetical protein H6925_00440 [Holosporaceae bacterium]